MNEQSGLDVTGGYVETGSTKIRYPQMSKTDRFFAWIAKHLPSLLVYHCAVRVLTHATTGKYSDTMVDHITAFKAIDRFIHDKHL